LRLNRDAAVSLVSPRFGRRCRAEAHTASWHSQKRTASLRIVKLLQTRLSSRDTGLSRDTDRLSASAWKSQAMHEYQETESVISRSRTNLLWNASHEEWDERNCSTRNHRWPSYHYAIASDSAIGVRMWSGYQKYTVFATDESRDDIVELKRLESWASAHRGKCGQLTPWKNGWKIKKRKHAKRSSFLWLYYILRAIRAGRCRERRYADDIFI